MGIEKIGLPAKPAAKGSAWVVDASSCQACQTPFSLFNRKHHCRRCGGLFCGNCSNSRVNLRGQGDGPVRVCEPCKKLEEAARFQARHRGKPSKGVSKGSSVAEDDTLLKEVLGDGIHSLLSGGSESMGGKDDDSAEVSPLKDKAVELKEENTSPEKLREESIAQKKIYSTLKREGKSAEALQAFKRHKELGREADALELSLKKLAVSQRKALAEGLSSAGGPVEKSDKESSESAKDGRPQGTVVEKDSSRGVAIGRKASKDGGDDDLLRSLKDLGWSEADLSERKAKKGPTSDMELLAEISDSLPKEASSKKPGKQNPTQLEILAHKRQALVLKREGKPAEAKEELKKAKVLERKLEEMTLFGDEEEEEDDDDELAVLMRSLEAKTGKEKESSLPADAGDIPLSFSLADDNDDANVDVTDDDINDPSMIAALQSMGWVDEAAAMERSRAPETGGMEAFQIAESINNQSSLQREILNHKRRALTLKREGKVGDAKLELQEAKILEHKLEVLKSQPISSQPIGSNTTTTSKSRGVPKGNTGDMRLEEVLEDKDDGVEVDDEDMRDPEMMAALKAMGFEEEETGPPLQTLVKPSPLEKKNLQDEILSIKRSALALRKQGQVVEAREELRQAKVLEQKLQKMQVDLEANGLPPVATITKRPQRGAQIPMPAPPLTGFVSEDEDEEVEVSADDFMDPDLVAALKSVGWQEEDTFVKDKEHEKGEEADAVPDSPPVPVQPYKAIKLPPKEHARKLQLQKDLLAHKRRALALKREGKAEEAKLELKQGKVLEKEMEEIENAALRVSKELQKEPIPQFKQSGPALPIAIGDESEEDEDVTDADMHDPELLDALKGFGWKPEPEKVVTARDSNPTPAPTKVDRTGSMKTVPNTGHKLDVTNPPYTKTVTESTSDPIWLAIMNSSSKKHNEDLDMVSSKKDGKESLEGEHSFDGEYGEIGSTVDMIPPLFDHPSSVNDDAVTASGQGHTFDLLSGGAWEAPVGTVPEKVEIKEDEDDADDDVFDSGLLAALQSIGLGPPSKDSSSKQVLGDAADAKGQTNGNSREKTGVDSGQRQQVDSVAVQNTRAETAEKSAASHIQSNSRKAGFLVPPKPVRSASDDQDSTDIVKEAAGASGEIHVLVADTVGASGATISEKIKVHKRRALTLKREGKQSEAREELRQAKILEKQLEMRLPELSAEHQSSDNVPQTSSLHSSASPEKPSQTVSPVKSQATPGHTQTHKEQLRQEVRQGKDRMKLQQESLAHKRKALGLRRQGKTDEAEAEFELAKTLEKQMEDLDGGARAGQSGKGVSLDPGDMGMVEDLLDPQLMAALKGLGWNDGDLHGGAANVSRASASSSNLNKSSQQPNSQAGKSTIGRPASTSATTPHETIPSESVQHTQSTQGRRSAAVNSANKVQQEEMVASRSSQQSQTTGGRSTVGAVTSHKLDDERVGANRPSQGVVPVGSGGRSTALGANNTLASSAKAERRQLEDRIKQEKVKAVELKRAGQQGEALEVLRGAKRLEKQLLSMTS